MLRTPRLLRPTRGAAVLALVLSGSALAAPAATAAASPATASPAAFCAKVKAYNTTIATFVKKHPADRAGLAKQRVAGWNSLAKVAPPAVATGLKNMATAVGRSFPPAQADMAAVLPYIEQNCKVRLA